MIFFFINFRTTW